MMTLDLSPRDRRTLIVGALVLLPLLLGGKALPAALEWQQRQMADAALMVRKVVELRASRRSLPALRDTLIARRARLASVDSLLVTGISPASAAAELASLVESLADSARIKIGYLQLKADSGSKGPITAISVRLNGLADVGGLAALLRAVEGNNRPMIVRELSVVPADPAGSDTRPEVLRVDLLVEGLARVVAEGRR